MADWQMIKGIPAKPTPLPGVYQRKEGGHVVRGSAIDPTTGRKKEILKVLPNATAPAALAWLEDEKERIRSGVVEAKAPSTRFADFAERLKDEKVARGDIRSAKGREKWRDTLIHLILGTTGPKSGRNVKGLGDYFVDRLTDGHVEAWRGQLAKLVAAGDYSPNTVNGWLSILRVILKAAKRQILFDNFDTSEHETYTAEEPNALDPQEVGPYLERFRELFPQHFGMLYLGLVTGLRPSTLRPLRRRGDEADVKWDENRILVRRSHTVGDEVMRTTKTKRRYPITLPEEAMDVLRWHVRTQLTTPQQEESDLLFPSVVGGYRTPCVLNGPMAEVAEDLGLGKKVSQRALRRTFNDLARDAQVKDLVTRSISGHATEKMQDHYSTVRGEEQREAIGRVIALFGEKRRTG